MAYPRPLAVSILLVQNGHRNHDLFAAAIRAKGWRLSLAVAAQHLGEQVRRFTPDVVLVVSGGDTPREDRALVGELQLLPKVERPPLVIINERAPGECRSASNPDSSAPVRTDDAERLIGAVERAMAIANLLVLERRNKRHPERRPKRSRGERSTLH